MSSEKGKDRFNKWEELSQIKKVQLKKGNDCFNKWKGLSQNREDPTQKNEKD